MTVKTDFCIAIRLFRKVTSLTRPCTSESIGSFRFLQCKLPVLRHPTASFSLLCPLLPNFCPDEIIFRNLPQRSRFLYEALYEQQITIMPAWKRNIELHPRFIKALSPLNLSFCIYCLLESVLCLPIRSLACSLMFLFAAQCAASFLDPISRDGTNALGFPLLSSISQCLRWSLFLFGGHASRWRSSHS